MEAAQASREKSQPSSFSASSGAPEDKLCCEPHKPVQTAWVLSRGTELWGSRGNLKAGPPQEGAGQWRGGRGGLAGN